MVLSTMQPSAASELLELWERAVAASPADRADILLAARLEAPPASLSARNAALLLLRAWLFGRLQSLRCTCTRCASPVEFSVDCEILACELTPAGDTGQLHSLEADGFRLEFRVPVAEDVRFASARASGDAFVEFLWRRCVTRCDRADGTACDPASVPESVADALSRRMEALEPGAAVSFDVVCPECDARWSAQMDCGEVLWSEVQSRAERLLLEIDALARAYGWCEPEVLALSATRRAAYLQLVGAA
jgi:hypothetical protein